MMTQKTEQERAEFEDGAWYWVEKEGWIGEPPIIAPALYKRECDAWYSVKFSGIPTRHLKVLEPCEQAASRAQVVPELEPVEGDQLPPIGSRVFIRHGRDDDAHACIVNGYYVWGDLKGDKRLHRVFVRMVYEGTQTQNARMLCDCYKTEAEALAAAQKKPCKYGDQCLHGCGQVVGNGSEKSEVDRVEFANSVLQGLLAQKKAKEAMAAKGICPECEGDGVCGGQFTGGEWECAACAGTGKFTPPTPPAKPAA